MPYLMMVLKLFDDGPEWAQEFSTTDEIQEVAEIKRAWTHPEFQALFNTAWDKVREEGKLNG